MSLEKLINSALKKGAGVSLKSVKQSSSYSERLHRKQQLMDRYSPNTHRGIAFRAGPMVFWSEMCMCGEKTGLKYLRDFELGVSEETLATEALIEELGEQLVNAAAEQLAPNLKEMAKAYRKAKTAEDQIGLLLGLDTVIDLAADRRHELSKDKLPEGVPVGYWWVDQCFEEQDPERFLPKLYKRLPKHKMPNCLGMSILLAGWAKLAGAKTMYCTEIVHRNEEGYRFRLSICQMALATLNGVPGKQARDVRKILRGSVKTLRGYQENARDWHHGIAFELKDGRWFYLDPYNNQSQVFPPEWNIPAVAKRLRKYQEVLPGLTVLQEDHGSQKRYLEGYLERFAEAMSQAQICKYKLAENPGNRSASRRLLEIAPELEYLCDLLIDANPRWPRPAVRPSRRLDWLLFAWDYEGLDAKSKPKDQADRESKLFLDDPKFRRQKLDDLIVEFCRQGLEYTRTRKGQINPAIEFGNTSYSVAMTVLSNLSSWTDEKVPGTLLLRYGSGQMLWHQAVSSVSDLDSLDDYEASLLRLGGLVTEVTPQQTRVKFKLQAIQDFLHRNVTQEE